VVEKGTGWRNDVVFLLLQHIVLTDELSRAGESFTRVTTHLENLEKSGNSKVVREKSGEVKSSVFFQALNSPKLGLSAGALPRRALTPLGELKMLPQTP